MRAYIKLFLTMFVAMASIALSGQMAYAATPDTTADVPSPLYQKRVAAIQTLKTTVLDVWAQHLGVPSLQWKMVANDDYVCGSVMAKSGAEFCMPNHIMYVSENAFAWDVAGPLGVMEVVGHEFGHYLHSLRNPNGAVGIQQERQANCASGAMIKWLQAARRELGITDAKVAVLKNGLLGAVSDEVHGSATLMAAAFNTGYQSGLAACVPIGGSLAGV